MAAIEMVTGVVSIIVGAVAAYIVMFVIIITMAATKT